MHSATHNLRRFLVLSLCAVIMSVTLGALPALAGSLTTMSDVMSDDTAGQTGVSHTINFTTATTSNLGAVHFQFSTTSGGTTKPAGLDLSSATLTSTTNLSTGWVIDTTSAASGLLKITNNGTPNISNSTAATVVLGGITNSDIDDCQSSNDILADTCYVNISTYSDTAGTSGVDNGTTTYTVVEEPFITFEIEAVSSGSTNNGVTTTASSTSTTIPFGRLMPGDVKYVAQKLTITTNAPHGYTVNAYLTDTIVGQYNGNEIDPFGATNATWSTPQNWSTPTGTTKNADTGWIGANTSDTRVSGWNSGSGKFGPISGIAHAVATSTTPDRTGTEVYVTYALGVNSMQPSDIYEGVIVYAVEASY